MRGGIRAPLSSCEGDFDSMAICVVYTGYSEFLQGLGCGEKMMKNCRSNLMLDCALES